ncbi:MAG: lactate utilization protein, partial [Planctomycetes bacterium]|nr:lactate utilization protein [Planctomycetota bacterium]
MDLSVVKTNLEKHRFRVGLYPTREAAAEHLEATVAGETIGFGGSVTIEEMGLEGRLAKRNTVIWHWRIPENRARYREFTAYLTSVNALAATGEMVNIDGSGNRLSATLFGPRKVYFVIGRNKVCPDLPSAIARAQGLASPRNNQRLSTPNPCVKDGKCHDCNSPARICCALVIHMRPMLSAEHTEVLLI